eukprot:CAMPEP_0194067746 /NCGR_PEP_ID=MMETSP0009_2-20130614/86721_1 /TAXON_ID=210454 /ORGANISM="Grammatophora oceanica, Strain CCMP 410" /LENGTH=429 /DNA_ID=CAMNT_0038720785 /DNA_START=64 /DNA_END=1354 /DNA_ORIENTATION=-
MNSENDVQELQRKKRQFDGEGDHELPKRIRQDSGSKLQRSGIELIETPHDHDVLCGRGGYVNSHKGNVAYRRVVDYNKETYHTCKKQHKILLSRSIVEAVQAQDPPGRFLQKYKKTGKWFDIGYDKALLKASQALREGAEDVRKQIHRATRVDVNNDATESTNSPTEQVAAVAATETISVEEATSDPEPRETPLHSKRIRPEPPTAYSPTEQMAAVAATETIEEATSDPEPRETPLHSKRIRPEPPTDHVAPSSPAPNTSPRETSMKPITDMDDFSVFSKGVFKNLEEEFRHGALMGCDNESVGDGQRSFVPPSEGPVLDAYMGIPLPVVKARQQSAVLHVYAGVPLPSPPSSPKYRPNTTVQTSPDSDGQSSKDISDEIKSVVSLDGQDELSLTSDEVLFQKLIMATHNPSTFSSEADGSSTQEVWEL